MILSIGGISNSFQLNLFISITPRFMVMPWISIAIIYLCVCMSLVIALDMHICTCVRAATSRFSIYCMGFCYKLCWYTRRRGQYRVWYAALKSFAALSSHSHSLSFYIYIKILLLFMMCCYTQLTRIASIICSVVQIFILIFV